MSSKCMVARSTNPHNVFSYQSSQQYPDIIDDSRSISVVIGGQAVDELSTDIEMKASYRIGRH